GRAERDAALAADIGRGRRATLGADKSYDARAFVQECRERNVTPHVAPQRRRRGKSAAFGRTTRHTGYEVSQVVRRRVTAGSLRRTRWRGIARTQMAAFVAGAAYNLMRIARLHPIPLVLRERAVVKLSPRCPGRGTTGTRGCTGAARRTAARSAQSRAPGVQEAEHRRLGVGLAAHHSPI